MAIKCLKDSTKKNPSDATNWQYLGLAYMSKNQVSDALKAFKKAIDLNPDNAANHANAAYAHLIKNHNDEAYKEAQKALDLNNKVALAYYVLGSLNLKDDIYSSAYERASRTIQLNPDFAAAYFLKSQSLISSFAQQIGTVLKTPDSRSKLLVEAAENIEKYMKLLPNDKHTQIYQEYLKSLKFFAEYYNRRENEPPQSSDSKPSAGETPLHILQKRAAPYTDEAKENGTQGIIRLLVGFSSDGKTKHVLVIKSLGDGLDEEAVSAARDVRFKPAVKNGTPVSVVKIIEYSFRIG